MTKKELKEIIKASLMEETSKPHGNIGAYTPENEPLGFLEEQEDEIEIENEEEVEIEAPTRELSAEEEIVQGSLEKALEAAKKLNNDKLVTQIANTITFFTRSEVIKEELYVEDIKAKFLRTLRMS